MQRRGLFRVVTASAAAALLAPPARASLSRAVPLEELVTRSRHVIVGEPLEGYSVWERIGERRHIVTYTRVRAHELLTGDDPGQSELLVRTLGGRVGELGELVHGEARLSLGNRGVLFITQGRSALSVTAMAQGHYPLRRDQAGIEKLRRSPAAAELTNQAGSAVERLPGLGVAEARALLRQVEQR